MSTHSLRSSWLTQVFPCRAQPADVNQMTAIVKKVFFDQGLRFVFSTRAKVPFLLKEGTQEQLYGGQYEFVPGKDEVRDGHPSAAPSVRC